MRTKHFLPFVLLLAPTLGAAQGVGINIATPDASALLDLSSTGKGLLIPRMNTIERDAIPVPALSLMIFNTSAARFEYFNGSAWVPLAVSGGTLDQAYDFGGTGAGRTITADAGAVLVNGTDGIVSTGTLGIGAAAPSGPGVRMVWNPNKAAFRAGSAFSNQWDDANIGVRSAAFGSSTASGANSIASGSSVASGEGSVALGFGATASGYASVGLGYGANASSAWAYALGYLNNASGGESAAIGSYSTASGYRSVTLGSNATASGSSAKSLAYQGEAYSYGETVLGIGPTTYTPSTNGSTQFRTANNTDRLLVVGNAIDANNNFNVDASERSDALVILKNGNTGMGTSTPVSKLHVRFTPPNNNIGPTLRLEAAQVGSAANVTFENSVTANSASMGMLANGDFGLHMGCNFGGCITGTEALRVKPNGNFGIGTINATERLHVVGTIRMVDGNQAAGRVMVSDALGRGSWQALAPATATAWGLLGNAGTDPATNFIGTTGGEDLVVRTSNTERMRVLANGNVGIGTPTPAVRMQVNGAIATEPGISTIIANGMLIANAGRSFMLLSSTGIPSVRVIGLQNGLAPGQVLVIACTGTFPGNGITITDSTNVSVSGANRVLDNEDTISFIWSGTKWLETSFSQN
ncbi:MAG: hypothetical protein R2817_02125 [Flavobacteriales bacterium]